METEIEFTELEESILACNSILSKIDSLVRTMRNWDIQEHDYTYIVMKEGLILEICKYIEEYEQRLVPLLTKENKQWIIKTHSPLFNCLNSSNLRQLRNKHIAHPHRDINGHFVFLMDTVQDSPVVVDELELYFLAECTKALIFSIAGRLRNEATSAKEKYEKLLSQEKYIPFFNPESQFKSYDDINRKLRNALKECDSIFNSEFPDEESWNKREGKE